MLNDGAVTAIGDGFARFIAIPTIHEQIEKSLEKEIQEAKTNPYNTHPPLRDRIAATRKRPAGFLPEDPNPARSLLDDAEALELRFLESMNPDVKPGILKCVPWDEVGKRVTIPAWKKFTSEYSLLV